MQLESSLKKAKLEARYVKLTMLGKKSFVSRRGIDALLRTVKSEGLPTAFSRSTQYRARKSVCGTVTPYGKLVQEVDLDVKHGKETIVGFQHPWAMLYHAASTSSDVSKLIEKTIATHPPSIDKPWNIILYQDGVDPSDGLSVNKSRKSNVLYWTILEFDHEALAHEELWFTATLIRSKSSDDFEGAMVALTRLVLMQFFDPNGHDSRRSGITLQLIDGRREHIYAKLGVLLADEVAIKEMIGCKGHAGTTPCLCCVNCVLFRQGVADVAWWERSAYFKSIAEPDLTPFVFYTDETLREAVRRLHAAKGDVTKTDFDQLQQQYGWGYVKEDLLLDEHIRLDAISITMVDWSHTYIANGIADVEFGEFMHTMRKTQTTYKELGSYSSSWSYPRLYASLNNLFEHNKDSGAPQEQELRLLRERLLDAAPRAGLLSCSRFCSQGHGHGSLYWINVGGLVGGRGPPSCQAPYGNAPATEGPNLGTHALVPCPCSLRCRGNPPKSSLRSTLAPDV